MHIEIAKSVMAHLKKFPFGYPVSADNDEWRLLEEPFSLTDEEGEVLSQLMPYSEHVDDIAKRLMDYCFHAPTTSFPVIGTIMVEPTESEFKQELDSFCDAMLAIYEEIQEIISGKANQKDNVLKNAPHTSAEIVSNNWNHPYSREKAAYPLPFIGINKFWPPVGRIDNTYGDRNLFCTCPPIEAYAEETKES